MFQLIFCKEYWLIEIFKWNHKIFFFITNYVYIINQWIFMENLRLKNFKSFYFFSHGSSHAYFDNFVHSDPFWFCLQSELCRKQDFITFSASYNKGIKHCTFSWTWYFDVQFLKQNMRHTMLFHFQIVTQTCNMHHSTESIA